MKRVLRTIFTAAAVTAAMVCGTVNAAAEDVSLDVSSAVESTNWGQSVTINKSEFDAMRITKDSIIKVAYEAKDYDGDELPIELIFQSWSNDTSPNANEDGEVWARVQTDDFDGKSATYTYEDIVAAYGTEDFSQVQAIHVGDTNLAPAICKGIAISNCEKAKDTGEVSIDCSAAKASAHFGQSMVVRFETFDATTFTNKSKIKITYEAQDVENFSASPVNLAIQSWENSNSPYADSKGNVWVTVEPESFDETTAVFDYADLVDAYGTADFSRVSALNFCDKGTGTITVKSITMTECVAADKGTHIKTEEESPDDSSAEDESKADDESSSEEAVTTTTAATTTAAPADNNDEKSKGSNILWIIIGVVAGVGIAIAVIFIILTRKSSEEYDISRGRMVSKKKHKTKW